MQSSSRRAASLSRRLALSAAALVLPAMLLGVGMLWAQYHAGRLRAEAQLLEQARGIARLVDQEFGRAEAAAIALAASSALARDDLVAFDGELRATRDRLSTSRPGGESNKIAFFDAEGRRRVYTSWPVGELRIGARGLPYVEAAITAGRAQVSDLINDPKAGPPCAAVAVPVFAPTPGADGRARVLGAVAVTVARERLLDIVLGAGLPRGGFASVQDREGVTIARSFHDTETLGTLPMPAVPASIKNAEAGLVIRGARTLEGVPSTIAFARAPINGYTVKLDVPEAVFLAPLWSSLMWTVGLGGAVLAVSLLLALLLARRIVAAFRLVPRAALQGMAQGGATPAPTGLREADELAASLSAALAEREQASASIRALFESSPVGVVISDLCGGVHTANDAFLDIVGRSRTELEAGAIRWNENTPPEWLGRDKAAVAEAVATGRCTPYEKEYSRPDGSRVPVLLSFGLTDPAKGLAATFVVDLRKVREAEMARRESEARFRAITDAMPQMVWSTRPDGHHDFYNQRWYEMTGTTPEQTMGGGWNPVLHSEDRERVRARWRHSLTTGEPYEVEYRLRMADSSYRWVLGRALPVRDEHGQIVRWFGTCTDIEEIVDAREVLSRSREDLERLVAERTRNLRETQERLAHLQRMEALGQLAGGIAHDFNNVLQAVQGGAGLIERRPGDPEGVRRLARMVFEATERGAAVTRRLLAFSRHGDLRTEAVDPMALLTDMREVFMHTLGAGIEVRVEMAPGLPLLLADKGQLETVLVNLATNARDAMGGSGTLVLAAAAEVLRYDDGPSLPVNLKAGSYIRLSVVDTGAGMVPEVLARVSEPFFTTKERGKGTGLGLAMARGFAEQSGGGLHIESAPGQGTTVKLWFPLAEAASAAVRPPGESVAVKVGMRGRVLVVDDEPFVREVIAEGMEAAGYAIRSVPSAAEALELLDAGEQLDVIVSDLSMPGMDGLALIREAQRRRPKLPAILLTGFATNAAEIAVGGAVSGAFTLLRKPVAVSKLAERVATLLEDVAALDEAS